MASLWIIDGYNLLRQSPRFSDLENESKAKQSMLRWLDQFVSQTGESVCVVFDAYSDIRKELLEDRVGGVKILSSRGAYTADEEIIEMARQKGEAAIVISSDKMILKEAIRAKASVLSSLEFEKEVNKILLRNEEDEREREDQRTFPSRGNAFRPPREKKKAYQLLRKYYLS